ncbi:MAG: tetratricopeptide repeat protein [Desulfobaccales bacterium]
MLIFGALLAIFGFVLACSSLEEKREHFMTQGKASFEKGDFITARLHFKNALQIDPQMAEGHLWLGKTELRLQNPRGAFGSLSKAAELKPDLTEAQLTLGNLLLLAKKPDEAEAKAKIVLEKEPGNTDALMLLAGVALAREEPPKALEVLDKVKKLDPHKVQAYLMQSVLENREKRPEAAAATLEEGIKANPKATALYIARARLAEQEKQLDQAETLLHRAGEIAPNDPGLQDELARLYIMRNQLDKAEEALRRRAGLEPDKEGPAAALARFLAGRGRYEEGLKVLTEFIDKHPDNVEAKFALANFYLAHRKFGPGERLLREIAAADPMGPGGLRAKGELAALSLGRGQQEEADKLVQEVLKANPKDMTALKIQGLMALNKKDGLKAVSNFRILTQDQPQNHENWLLLARAHQIANEQELAKEAAKKALTLKPDYTEAQALLYGIYIQNKDYDPLIKLIKDYLRADDRNLANWGFLGDVYVLKGETKEAQAAFQKMVTLQPRNPAGYMKLALLSRKNKQIDQAARHLEDALRQNPDAHPALRLLLGLYQESNQPGKALEAARAAVARAPKNAEIHQILGEVFLAQKQPEAAAAALIEALTLDPNDPQALGLLVRAYELAPDKAAARQKLADKVQDPKASPVYALALAQLYERQHLGDQAIAVYESLLERKVALPVVKNNLAYLLAEHRATPENLIRAQQLAAGILEDNPDDPRLLDTMGWIYCKQKEFDKAKAHLERAVAKAPEHPVLQYHLGFCLAQLGETGPARAALEKSLAAKGDFPQRDEAQKLLNSLPKSP